MSGSRCCDSKNKGAYLSALDLCNSPVLNIEFDELDFQSVLNLNFTGYSLMNSIIQTGELQKSSADRQRVWVSRALKQPKTSYQNATTFFMSTS